MATVWRGNSDIVVFLSGDFGLLSTLSFSSVNGRILVREQR